MHLIYDTLEVQGLGELLEGAFPLEFTYSLLSKSSPISVQCFVAGDFISCVFLTA